MSDRTASGASTETAPEKPNSTTRNLDPTGAEKANGGTLPPGAFDQLRNLLVGPEQQRLVDLQKKVSDLPTAVADVLPKAVKHASRENSQLREALMPLTEENIVQSVKRNPRTLADALFPIIGPATRKAIAEALGAMVQSLNQTLEHSFSVQGLKWRIEGWRTGKSFAEVVMLKTLVYRVEQVFLIHKETGLLLHHVAAAGTVTEDADMVSGMMTAIQDFVQDSFQGGKADKSGTLDTFRVGDLVVWIEQGALAIVEGVMRVKTPEDLRLIFHQALEKIHNDFGTELKEFQGDAALFEGVRPELQSCLQAQYGAGQEEAKPKSRLKPLHVIGAVLLLALLVGGFFWVREYRRWNAYVTRLKSEPGLVLIGADRGWFGYSVRGLRDPLAADPNTFAADASLNPQKIEASWEPYHSLSSEFIKRRAQHVLQPPASIALTYDDGKLSAAGVASREWISQSRLLARALPGVNEYRDENVVEAGRQELNVLKQKLETITVRFQENSSQLVPGQETAIDELIAGFRQLYQLAPGSAREMKVQIIGHTDTTGTEHVNLPLSRERAEAIRALLAAKVEGMGTVEIVGMGTSAPLRPETTPEDREFNRSVTIKVNLTY
jgi:OOP family OmpA-OmpF porin